MSRRQYHQHGSQSPYMPRWAAGMMHPPEKTPIPRGFGRGWRRFRPHRSETVKGWATQPPVDRGYRFLRRFGDALDVKAR